MTSLLFSCDQSKLSSGFPSNHSIDTHVIVPLARSFCDVARIYYRIQPLFETQYSKPSISDDTLLLLIFPKANLSYQSDLPLLPSSPFSTFDILDSTAFTLHYSSACVEVSKLLGALFSNWPTMDCLCNNNIPFHSLPGSDGWASFNQIFSFLNLSIQWCLLRNHEYHLTESFWENDQDLDILSSRTNLLACALNAQKRFGGISSFYTFVEGKQLLLDLREVGDKYYDPIWCSDVLSRRQNLGIIAIPSLRDQLYLLLYHVLLQKHSIKAVYLQRLINMAEQLSLSHLSHALHRQNTHRLVEHLDEFLHLNHYRYTYCKDCYVNKENIRLLSSTEYVANNPILSQRIRACLKKISLQIMRRLLPSQLISASFRLSRALPPSI